MDTRNDRPADAHDHLPDKLAKLAALHATGELSDAEFAEAKHDLLAESEPSDPDDSAAVTDNSGKTEPPRTNHASGRNIGSRLRRMATSKRWLAALAAMLVVVGIATYFLVGRGTTTTSQSGRRTPDVAAALNSRDFGPPVGEGAVAPLFAIPIPPGAREMLDSRATDNSQVAYALGKNWSLDALVKFYDQRTPTTRPWQSWEPCADKIDRDSGGIQTIWRAWRQHGTNNFISLALIRPDTKGPRAGRGPSILINDDRNNDAAPPDDCGG